MSLKTQIFQTVSASYFQQVGLGGSQGIDSTDISTRDTSLNPVFLDTIKLTVNGRGIKTRRCQDNLSFRHQNDSRTKHIAGDWLRLVREMFYYFINLKVIKKATRCNNALFLIFWKSWKQPKAEENLSSSNLKRIFIINLLTFFHEKF